MWDADRAIALADDGADDDWRRLQLAALVQGVSDRHAHSSLDAGVERRVDRLFREYHQPLVRYLTRRLGDRDWAEEVAQETFLRAVKQETILSEALLALRSVATNLVRDEARKDIRRRRRLELLREQARADEIVEPEPLSIERAQEAALARKALDQLTERDREALLMREEGLDYTGDRDRARAFDHSRLARRWRERGVDWSKHMNRSRATAPGALFEEPMQHLDEGTIHAWLDGALTAEEAGARRSARPRSARNAPQRSPTRAA